MTLRTLMIPREAEGKAAGSDAQPTAEQILGKGGEYIAEPAHKMPEGGSEKFFNAKTGEYNWHAHAKEADFKISQKAGKDKADTEADAPPAEEAPKDADTTDADAAKEAVTNAGLDWDALGQAIVQTGDIGKDAREALIKQGIPEKTIDRFVALERQDAAERLIAVTDALGGEENVPKLIAWAQRNLTADQRKEYDKRLNSPDQMEAAASELMSKAGMTRAKAPLRGDSAVAGESDVKPFASDDAFHAALRDKRYKTDPEYRAEVAARAAATPMTESPRFHNSGFRR